MNNDDARDREHDGLRRAMAHAAEHFEDFERKMEFATSLVGQPQTENHFASQISAAMQKAGIGR